jgi:hypothetical protein
MGGVVMKLDTNGLPPPGRELDYFIVTRVLKQSPPDTSHADVFTDYEWFQVGAYHWERKSPDDFEHPGMYPVRVWPEYYSTTHAFFQVMEAMSERGYEWRFTDNLSWLLTEMDRSYGDKGERVELPISHYPDRLHAYAHAVCAAAWMAMGGEVRG